MTSLDPWVTEAFRASAGRPPLCGEFVDYVKAFRDDPALVMAAKEEVERLAKTGGMRVLAVHDYESRVRHDTLVRMLAAL